MDMLAETRRGEGKETPGLDIALHVGTVQYGNVGTDARLDFTVIGPAVNEAARIEVLCKELGQPLVMSAAFADSATWSGRISCRSAITGCAACARRRNCSAWQARPNPPPTARRRRRSQLRRAG